MAAKSLHRFGAAVKADPGLKNGAELVKEVGEQLRAACSNLESFGEGRSGVTPTGLVSDGQMAGALRSLELAMIRLGSELKLTRESITQWGKTADPSKALEQKMPDLLPQAIASLGDDLVRVASRVDDVYRAFPTTVSEMEEFKEGVDRAIAQLVKTQRNGALFREELSVFQLRAEAVQQNPP